MGRHLRDVLTFSGVTAAVGGSQPLQLYCHRHNSIIVIGIVVLVDPIVIVVIIFIIIIIRRSTDFFKTTQSKYNINIKEK